MNDLDTGKLEEIFRVVLDLPAGTDLTTVRRVTHRRWDSLAQVSLVAAIESEFGVVLDSGDIERLTSYEGARLLLMEKNGHQRHLSR